MKSLISITALTGTSMFALAAMAQDAAEMADEAALDAKF